MDGGIKMRIKPGATIAGLNIKMRAALMIADKLWKEQGEVFDQAEDRMVNLSEEGTTVTSGLDGEHSAGSLHYYGYAVDLRTRYFSLAKKHDIENELRIQLGPDFRLFVHASHFHVDCKPYLERENLI
jgi:hypothetical protein